MLLSTNITILSNAKSGRDLHKSPELLPAKEENFFHSFLLISIRNTAFKREKSETRLQEVMEESKQWAIFIVNELAEYFIVNP